MRPSAGRLRERQTAVVPVAASRRRAARRAVSLLLVGFAAWTLVSGFRHGGGWKPVADVAELFAAAAACAAALGAADRCRAAARRSWVWLGAGLAAWTVGEAYWTWMELVRHQEVPVPSVGDAAFLLLLPCAAVALVLHPALGTRRHRQRFRLLLDGTTLLVSLLVFAWPLTIRNTWAADDGWAVRLTLVAYPLGDLLLAALVLTLLTHAARGSRPLLLWLLGGVLALTLADSVFAYLAAQGSTAPLSVADLLWVLGFSALAVAGRRERGRAPTYREQAAQPTSRWVGLPYALVGFSALVIASRWLMPDVVGQAEISLFLLLGGLVYLRQYTVLRDNKRLLAKLAAGREQMHQQGLRDPLTGLANRDAFLQRVESALSTSSADGDAGHVVVKFRLADAQLLGNLGTDDQDLVIYEVAARIRRCLREDDELARMADSTFAVLRRGGQAEGHQLAAQVIGELEDPVQVHDGRRQLRLAAGVAATTGAGTGSVAATQLLQRAAVALNSIESPAGGIASFDQEVLRRHAERVELREALAQAVQADPATIRPVFEPVVCLADGTLSGVAVRAEWQHATGTISGGGLADLAREAGIGARVDDALLAQAVSTYGGWLHDLPGCSSSLWVSIAADSLAGAGFPGRVSALLRDFAVPAGALVLDAIDPTGQAATAAEVERRLEQARSIGATLVMNDVMTVGDRPALPGEVFQISSQLVDRCAIDLRARRLIQTTVEFADARAAATAARNVVTAEQDEELRALGCRLTRGPLYGSGLAAPDMARLLAESAAGSYRAPTSAATGRTRSSRAWQELRTVVSSLPLAALACASDGTIVMAEGGLLERLGVHAGALTGQSISEVARAHRVDTAPLDRALAGAATTAIVRIGGHWLEARLHPVSGPDGQVTGLMLMAIDVTDRVLAEQAMRRSEEQFRAIFDRAPVGVVLIGPDTRIQQANAAIATMLGHTREELEGRDLGSLWHPDTPPGSREDYESLRFGGGPGYRAERAYRHKDGSPVWTRVTVGPLGDAAAAGSVIGIVEDLREVKALEVKLRHAQKLESIGMLAAGIAHEINTPTQFVGDNLTFLDDAFRSLDDLLQQTERLTCPVDDAAGQALRAARDAADVAWLREQIPAAVTQSLDGIGRVATIVQAMRNFGHPDGRDATTIDINAAIRDTTTVTRNEYKYVADLVLDLGDVPSVVGYPSEFNQVILNLVVNAAHAIGTSIEGTSQRGTIRIRTWADEAYAHVSVRDDGCGMTPQTRERIFDPFFTTKPVGRGTGQGLAISHNVIVDKHAGAIDVESELGVGSTFTIDLPLTRPAAA
jgi:PAS domain S-box-containing protein